MKSKHANRGNGKPHSWDGEDPPRLQYHSGLVALLDGVRTVVELAPADLEFRRESILGLLMAARYALEIEAPLPL